MESRILCCVTESGREEEEKGKKGRVITMYLGQNVALSTCLPISSHMYIANVEESQGRVGIIGL